MDNPKDFFTLADKLREKIQYFPDKPIENPEPVAMQKRKGVLLDGLQLMTREECETMHEHLAESEPELAEFIIQFIKQWK